MTSTPAIATMLERIGDVPMMYVHHDRRVEPSDPLPTETGLFKWQNGFAEADPVTANPEGSARTEAVRFLDSGVALAQYGMGLMVPHHSTEQNFLLIGSWRGHQEFWQHALFRAVNSVGAWTVTELGTMSPIACLWEMSPIWHERNA